jgi:N-acetylmuramic acid 6-phosphate etherase
MLPTNSSQINSHNLTTLTTETVDPNLADLDEMTVMQRLNVMNAADQLVPVAVAKELPFIADAIDLVVKSFQSGGRLIYIGAGTSGRLGILDAVECPPTFGTDPSMVDAVIAGGSSAVFRAVEGAEDDFQAGVAAIEDEDVDSADTVIGISASGQAPYVLGALGEAGKRGAATVAVTCNRPTQMDDLSQVTIAPIVGPEFVAGSTRLKAGTATKLVLNMITTNAMIQIGKTYGNRMVDLMASNSKLKARALKMTMDITGEPVETAELALREANGSVKLAILMIETGLNSADAGDLLINSDGFLRRALATTKR